MAKAKNHKELEPVSRGGMFPAFGDEMERMFERFLGRGFGPAWMPRLRWPEEMKMPYTPVDIYEDDKNVILKAELPGMKKDEVEVEIAEDMVTISGEKKKEEEVTEKDYYRMERSSGSFRRSFTLPAEVQAAKARAKFTDGMLEITMPKTAESKPRKVKVEVEG